MGVGGGQGGGAGGLWRWADVIGQVRHALVVVVVDSVRGCQWRL